VDGGHVPDRAELAHRVVRAVPPGGAVAALVGAGGALRHRGGLLARRAQLALALLAVSDLAGGAGVALGLRRAGDVPGRTALARRAHRVGVLAGDATRAVVLLRGGHGAVPAVVARAVGVAVAVPARGTGLAGLVQRRRRTGARVALHAGALARHWHRARGARHARVAAAERDAPGGATGARAAALLARGDGLRARGALLRARRRGLRADARQPEQQQQLEQPHA